MTSDEHQPSTAWRRFFAVMLIMSLIGGLYLAIDLAVVRLTPGVWDRSSSLQPLAAVMLSAVVGFVAYRGMKGTFKTHRWSSAVAFVLLLLLLAVTLFVE